MIRSYELRILFGLFIEDERSEVPTTSACVEYLSHEQSSQLVVGTRSVSKPQSIMLNFLSKLCF